MAWMLEERQGGARRGGQPACVMTPERGRRRAGVLVILAGVLWWHAWLPAHLAAAFVVWVLLHHVLEGERRHALLRQWRRASGHPVASCSFPSCSLRPPHTGPPTSHR